MGSPGDAGAGHLAGRLVGEGNGQHLTWIDTLHPDQIRDAVGQDAGLTTSSRRQDEERPLVGGDRLALRGIQIAQEGLEIQH
jgi:hypothetical protein